MQDGIAEQSTFATLHFISRISELETVKYLC